MRSSPSGVAPTDAITERDADSLLQRAVLHEPRALEGHAQIRQVRALEGEGAVDERRQARGVDGELGIFDSKDERGRIVEDRYPSCLDWLQRAMQPRDVEGRVGGDTKVDVAHV